MPKIKVLDAVIDGYGAGAVLTVSDHAANYFVKIGYAERVADPAAEKAAAKPVEKAAPKAATRSAARKQQPSKKESKK